MGSPCEPGVDPTVYGLRRAYCSATFRARWLSARASGSGRCSHPQPEDPVVNGELLPEKIVAGSGPIPKLVVGDSSPEKLVVVGNSPETLGPRLRRQSTSCGREEHLSTQLQLAGALARPGKLAAAAAYSLRLEAGSGLSSWAVFMEKIHLAMPERIGGVPNRGLQNSAFRTFFSRFSGIAA
ncbi:hypothetical protein PR001_g27763 [Phytophthora rubi]|uniref:Uncharacterized protein n=1 Tax=Phytophthora rubi TaxID=129364 RepID=A0A6A3HKF5_9STRA|nr:hypothetical protein PR001_g27763 [Phytophthora rubi]KAE8969144.1 hypothetical protein PR002_g27524 [Phytophthora rubi]